jgi:hypothetical protein
MGDLNTVFTEAMPATASVHEPAAALKLNTCTLGVLTPCDAFSSVIRFTLAKNTLESGAWQAGSNVLVYRVELSTVGVASSDLYDAQAVYSALYQQGCNTNETGAAGAPASCVAATTASANFNYDLTQIAAVLEAWGSANTGGDAYNAYEASGSTGSSTNGGVGRCIPSGQNCAGGTQDTDFYRNYHAGSLKNLAPVFVVGVLHSDSPSDFRPNGTSVRTAAVNNADYTGISIADDSNTYQNTGVADAANPNSASEYYVPPAQRIMLGSAYLVLQYLHTGSPPVSLFNQLPASVQGDIDNIYIHAFQRTDSYGTTCSMQTCSNSLANDVTTIANPAVGAPPAPAQGSIPALIPDADPVLLTERGYLLAPTIGTMPGAANYTGGAVQFLQSPYIICDTVATGCGLAQ